MSIRTKLSHNKYSLHKAKVTSSNKNYQEKVNFRSSETTFEKRFSDHKKSFNLNEYKNETELSNEIWRLKHSGHHPKVKWDIVKKCVSYNTKKTLFTMQKVGNCCTEQNMKRNRIKILTPVEVCIS